MSETRSRSKLKYLVPKPPFPQYSPSTTLFASEQEHRYFRIFCEKTAIELSGCFDSVLWSRLVLQECVRDQGIRHVVVAIGALGVISRAFRLPSMAPKEVLKRHCEEAQRHRVFALQQYGIAIRYIRKSASERKIDMRTTLLGSLLIICFEMLHGNHQTAIAHIQSGIGLMEDWHARNTRNPTEILGTNSPSPSTVEDELLQAISRLDIQAVTFLDPRPKETHDRMRHYGQASINTMPTIFSSLKEARVYLEVVIRRLGHFLELILYDESEGCLKAINQSLNYPESVLADQRMYMKELRLWHASFMPLLEHSRTPGGREDFLGAIALETQYLISLFCLGAVPLDPETMAVRFTPVFKEIVTLSRAFLEHPDLTDMNYTFDTQIIAPLYITARRCSHSRIRREAIELLLSSPRREGVWDAVLMGKIASWVADIEEEDGLDGEFMPAGKGVVDIKFNFDLPARRVHVQCFQQSKGVGSPVERDRVITW